MLILRQPPRLGLNAHHSWIKRRVWTTEPETHCSLPTLGTSRATLLEMMDRETLRLLARGLESATKPKRAKSSP